MNFGFTDVVYTLKKGSARAETIMMYLKSRNIMDLRFGLNLVSVKSRNKYGDINYLLDTFKWLQHQGFRLHLYLFLSDAIANAGAGDCPQEWAGLTLHELAGKLSEDCALCTEIFRDNNIAISSYTVGNESEWGVCGYRLNDRIHAQSCIGDSDFEWLRGNLWQPTALILGKCCKAIKDHSPDSKIVIHSDSIGKQGFTYEYLDFLCKNGVNFDVCGLTYNPWTIWDEDYNNFSKIERTTDMISSLGKPIWIVEYSYPNKPVTNGELTPIAPSTRFPYTHEGQTAFNLSFIDFCEKHRIETLFFWRGEHELPDDISNETGIFKDGKMNRELEKRISGFSR